MSNELVPQIGTTTLNDQMNFARAVTSGGRGQSILPAAYQDNPGNVLIAVGLGASMGLSPAESLYRIAVIKGKPTAGAELIAANVRRAGHKLRITSTDTSATATIIRADDPDFTFEVTRDMEWAQRMGLAQNDNYRKQGPTMLQWRAITAVARIACPEALYGVAYTGDEMHDMDAPRPAHDAGQAGPAEVRIAQPTPPADDAPADDWQQPLDGSTPPEPTPPTPSSAQVRKMFAVLREAGFSGGNEESREAMLTAVADIIGREITSSSDLTAAETSAVVDALEDEAAS